ncbi:hypothetical protein CGRA01v4_13510 [Colletotrichum graminicola]|nr:hypothetical protein CGRA01v4_13510 [Colletotrichum graminicola]
MSYLGPVVDRGEGNSACMAEGVVLSGAAFGVPTAPRGGPATSQRHRPPPLLVLALERQAAVARAFSFEQRQRRHRQALGILQFLNQPSSTFRHRLQVVVLFSSSHQGTLGQLRQVDSTVVAGFSLLKPWSNRTDKLQRHESPPPFLSGEAYRSRT